MLNIGGGARVYIQVVRSLCVCKVSFSAVSNEQGMNHQSSQGIVDEFERSSLIIVFMELSLWVSSASREEEHSVVGD